MEGNATNGNGGALGRLNLGDWLHIVQIASLLVAGGMAYAKLTVAMDTITEHSKMLQRVEHYLSSKDANYWKLSRENE